MKIKFPWLSGNTAPPAPTDAAVTSALANITTQLSTLLTKVGTLSMTLDEFKAKLQAELDTLNAAVTQQTTVSQSVVTALQGQAAQLAALRQQLADAAAAAGIDPATVQPLFDTFDAGVAAINNNNASLTAAVTANTTPTA